jgi:quercetin dioxygenase-like cupin family protein
MDRTEFERKCQAEGYADIVDRQMAANHFNPDHAHEFDACVLVVDGEMTISRDGKPQTLRAGDLCTMAAGTLHSEQCGAAGAHYLAGRRYKQQAAN